MPSRNPQKSAFAPVYQLIHVSNYLTLFIEELFGEYGEVFLEDNKEDNLMKHNRIFSGYISLAAKMQEEGIALSKLGEILNKVDFSRKNKIWQEIGLLDSIS